MRLPLLALALLPLAVGGCGSTSSPGPPAAAARHIAARRAPRVHAPALSALRGAPVTVRVASGPLRGPLARDFLGLSFEAGDLPRLSRYAREGDLVALMRSLGPGVMRFGGVSVDNRAAFAPSPPGPAWSAVRITPAHLAGIAALARASGWSVLLGVTVGHLDPASAAREVALARASLGHRLIGVELGNEPDAYPAKHLRSAGYRFADYAREIAPYRSAIARAAPGVALAGPDASSGVPPLSWVTSEARVEDPVLLTDHFYPSSSCGYTPVLSDLLSPVTGAQETAYLERLNTIASAAHRPLRLDETNNISCGGQPGVSDSFASALWAVDYLMRVAHAGVDGVNFHSLIRKPTSYTPLAATGVADLDRGALRAQPEFYALLLARGLSGARPAPTAVSAPGHALSALAFVDRAGRLELLLDDLDPPGSAPLRVRLAVPLRYGPGPIIRLTARGPAARDGVRLAGRPVPADGSWSPGRVLPGVSGRPGSLALEIEPSSAALATLAPRR